MITSHPALEISAGRMVAETSPRQGDSDEFESNHYGKASTRPTETSYQSDVLEGQQPKAKHIKWSLVLNGTV